MFNDTAITQESLKCGQNGDVVICVIPFNRTRLLGSPIVFSSGSYEGCTNQILLTAHIGSVQSIHVGCVCRLTISPNLSVKYLSCLGFVSNSEKG